MRLSMTAIEEREHYLFVKVSGQWQLRHVNKLLESIAQEARQRHQRRVLIDALEMSGDATLRDRFETGLQVAHSFMGITVTALCPSEKISHFAENVAVNHGATFKVTANGDEALAWLLQDVPAGKPSRRSRRSQISDAP